ncbi:hypothetical protein [Streptomyces sp. A1-5]|uniref:hypothetical protein n=1 Tax=Streptomyces sp. A1-5 TaxID=2738410 RepID=UPI001F1CDB35|nr:hypothetical protein [Streptomyces sp. A1-5]UJB40087.1 hypothetical protein HRD51_03605 [Streptomyces sp. A1-5]
MRPVQPLRQRGLGLRLVVKRPAPPAPDAPDARERPPLPVRLPGQTLRRRNKAAPGSLVTVRALHRVIGLRRGTRWQEAASTALLGNDWLESLDHGKQLDEAALARLRAEILALHRQLTPVWR